MDDSMGEKPGPIGEPNRSFRPEDDDWRVDTAGGNAGWNDALAAYDRAEASYAASLGPDGRVAPSDGAGPANGFDPARVPAPPVVIEPVRSSASTPLVTFDDLLAEVSRYLPEPDLELVRQAYAVAEAGHEGVLRKSGDPYIVHPLSAALTLAKMRMDTVTIEAALLHDVIEDTPVTYNDIQQKFGSTVAKIVEGVTKFSVLETKNTLSTAPREGEARKRREERLRQQAESVRKMFIAMAEDPRVVIVKLADRLHNMRTLSALRREKQIAIATETREIYAPLAGRLGMGKIKVELEDLAFRYLDPEHYYWVANLVNEQRQQRQEYIDRVCELLRQELSAAGLEPAQVSGRAKHLWSIYKKLARANMDINLVYDLFAFRILVPEIQDCYTALGVVHSLWRPKDGRFKDYIAVPKVNGYQSIHTTVFCLDNRMAEIQIRTETMHRVAEHGVATHWHYKERGSKVPKQDTLEWIKQLVEWQHDVETSASEFVDTVKGDVFQDQIFVFTPQGDVKDLPRGSTPLDFAYRIHTQVGNTCAGARVVTAGGNLVPRLAPLNYELKSGEVIEIVTSKTAHPTRDWLNYARTAAAQGKIRQYLKKSERTLNIQIGRESLDRELKHLAQKPLAEVTEEDLKAAAVFTKHDSVEDMYAVIGDGHLGPQRVVNWLLARWKAANPTAAPVIEQLPATVAPAPAAREAGGSTVSVMGTAGLLTTLARCCRPIPGDDIRGYVTTGKGVSVHRSDCPNVTKAAHPERLVPVEWGAITTDTFLVPLRVSAHDRPFVMRDVLNLLAEDHVTMTAARGYVRPGNVAVVKATVEVKSLEQLSRIFARLSRIKDVLEVERDSGGRGNGNEE